MSRDYAHARRPVYSGPAPASDAAQPEAAVPTPLAVPVAGVARVAEQPIARKPGSATDPLGGTQAAPDVVDALRRRRGSGKPLPPDVAQNFGAHLGTDLSSVRVHTDGEADLISRSVGAQAFTHGSDIYFTSGRYQPDGSGQRLLAHELAHVAQNAAGQFTHTTPGTEIGRADHPAETAADKAADGVMAGLRRQQSPDLHAPASRTAGTVDALRRYAGPVESHTVRRLTSWFKSMASSVSKRLRGRPKAGVLAPQAATPEADAATTPQADAATTPQADAGTPQAEVATTPQADAGTPQAEVATTPQADAATTPQADAATTPQADAATTPQSDAATTPQADAATTPQVDAATTPQVDAANTSQTATAPEQQTAPEAPKTSKEKFTEALGAAEAPGNDGEGRARLLQLKALVKDMSEADRKTIWSDSALLDKALAFVGDKQKPALVAALGVFFATTPGANNPDLARAPHMTGAEADTFIQTEIAKQAHLKGFIDTAVGAGKKADGAVATLDAATWNKVYNVQYPDRVMGSQDERKTNAYIANKNEDRPALIHQDRGTRSTAIHESMHRYSDLALLNTFSSPLNEGITEYFTRLLTDKDGKPVAEGGPSRDNYQRNWEFVCALLAVLGANKLDQEKTLGQMYYEGKVDLLKQKFTEKWKATDGALEDSAIESKWTTFKQKVSGGAWDDAKAVLPA